MKRQYFLVAIAILQILVGSLMILAAAAPVRMSQDVAISSGTYHHFEFGVLGTARMSGNLFELQGRPFDLLVFDDPGYASFRDGSNAVPPLFAQNGTNIIFDLNLAGSGQFHVVVVDLPARPEIQVHLELMVVGLKPTETFLALVVLVGGLALVGATILMSVPSLHRRPKAPKPSPAPPDGKPDPSDDNTRLY